MTLNSDTEFISYTDILRELAQQLDPNLTGQDLDLMVNELKNKRDLQKFTTRVSNPAKKKQLDSFLKLKDPMGKTPYFDKQSSKEFIKFISLYEDQILEDNIIAYKKFKSGKFEKLSDSEWMSILDSFSNQLENSLGTKEEKLTSFTDFIDTFDLHLLWLKWMIKTELQKYEEKLFKRASYLPFEMYDALATIWFSTLEDAYKKMDFHLSKFEKNVSPFDPAVIEAEETRIFDDDLSIYLDTPEGKDLLANYLVDGDFNFTKKRLKALYGTTNVERILNSFEEND